MNDQWDESSRDESRPDASDRNHASRNHTSREVSGPHAVVPLRGIVIGATGALIGAISLGLFCYALGVNLRDEGWAEDRSVDRTMLVVSLVGFALATLSFWVGLIITTHPRT